MAVYHFDRAIAREPADTVVNGLRAGGQADPSLAGVRREHAAYVRALEDAGVAVELLSALPEFPDSIFVEDPALVFRQGAILLRPGAESRMDEAVHLKPALMAAFGDVLELPEGHADGGDVLTMPDRVFVGLSARTDRAGAAALIGCLAQLGLRGEVAHTPAGTLHLKTASSLVDEETVLATAPLAASGLFRNYRVLVVPDGEEGGANVLRVNDRLLCGTRFERTRDLLERHGLRTVGLETDEISRIDAGLTCMSLRWFAGRGDAQAAAGPVRRSASR